MAPRRSFLGTAVAGLAAASARAEETFPTRRVELVVPYAAGGPADRYARVMAKPLSELWRQPVVVANRAGGAASIGAAAVANAAPDGYTLLLASFGLVTNQILLRNLPYSPSDLTPISLAAVGGLVCFAGPRLPVKDAKELQAYGRANPGAVRFGSSGNGSTPHIAGELFAARAGIEMVHVPYRGSGPAMTDLVAGNIDLMFDPPTTMALVRDGKLRAIASTGTQRARLAPEVPTMQEMGFDVVARTWYGFLAPSATPASVQERIVSGVRSLASQEPISKVFLDDDLEPRFSDPGQFRGFLEGELRHWRDVIRERNIGIE